MSVLLPDADGRKAARRRIGIQPSRIYRVHQPDANRGRHAGLGSPDKGRKGPWLRKLASGDPDTALVSAGAEMKWLSGFSLMGTFEGEFSGNTTSYAGKGVARYTW
jgi:hypothetical protein